MHSSMRLRSFEVNVWRDRSCRRAGRRRSRPGSDLTVEQTLCHLGEIRARNTQNIGISAWRGTDLAWIWADVDEAPMAPNGSDKHGPILPVRLRRREDRLICSAVPPEDRHSRHAFFAWRGHQDVKIG